MIDPEMPIISPSDIVHQEILEDDGYVQSLVDEGLWYGGYESLDEALSAQEQARNAEAIALKIRNDFEMTYAPFFTQRKAVYEENYNFWESIQWTEKDIANLMADGLPSYVSNIMKRQIDVLTGEQKARETEWRSVGRSQEADHKTEFQNHLLRSVAQQNNWGRMKGTCFRDGVVGGTAFASAMADPADPTGNIKLQRHRPWEFMWHLETAENGSLHGTKFFWRGTFAQKTELMWQFPMWRDDIRNLQGAMYTSVYPWLDTLVRPKVRRTTGASVGNNGMIFDPWQSRLYRQMLFKREFYHRRMAPRWRVTNGYTASHYDCQTRAQADYVFAQLCEIWQINVASQTGADPGSIIPRIAQPRFVQVPVIDQEIWIGDRLVAVNRSDDEHPPYHSFIPEYNDGDITSYFEHSKDMQRLRNIAMTFMHKKTAAFKGKWTINKFFLGQDMTEQKINEMMMSEIKPLIFSSSDPDVMKKAFNYVNPPGQDNLAREIMQITSDDLNYQGGGLNAVGLQESAGESGRAINARQQTAAIATVSLMDEFEYFDKEVGERVLVLGQYLDPIVQFMAVDQQGDPSFMSMADAGIQDAKEMKYQVEVVQVLGSVTEREGEVNRLRDIVSQAPDTAPIIMPLILKKMDIDKSDRDQIEQGLQAQQQFAQEMQQRQVALAEFEAQQKWNFAGVDRQLKQREQDIEIMKIHTPNVSLTMKPTETPPALLAETVNAFNPNANADPVGVLMDQATHAKFRQDALDLQQVSRNELMTPDQRKIEAMKANPPKQVPSAEDTANRQNKTLS